MKQPDKTNLPYFAYGPFKPKEPAFYKIESLIGKTQDLHPPGHLFVRDGLPMLEMSIDGIVEGYLIDFIGIAESEEAYRRISEYFPFGTHQWTEISIVSSGIQCNCIVRIPPKPGNDDISEYEPIKIWSAKDDPLFSKAIQIVAIGTKKFRSVAFEKDEGKKFDWVGYYELQMKYLLLWSILERFMSLKIGLFIEHGPHGLKNIRQMFANEYQPFRDSCTKFIDEKLKITSFSNPDDPYLLQTDDHFRSIEFFHQLRTNLIHRGKSAEFDGERLRKSFLFLYSIVREILTIEGLFRG